MSHRQWIGIGAAIFLWSAQAEADVGTRVVTIGANLTAVQEQQMLSNFGVSASNTHIIIIQHQDEERLLNGVAPQSEIGTRSISSSMVTLEPLGYGIHVTTHDITWVTSAMYANALVTAGVKNARVVADAPFPVSGTAALAGILTAYQSASGTNLTYGQERTAAQEMMVTGNLGQQIGSKQKATTLIMRIKNTVVTDHLTNPNDIRPIVVNEANRLSISLTNTQITAITNVMVSISHLSLDAATLSTQLKGLQAAADSVAPPGLWQQVVHWMKSLWQSIIGMAHSVGR